MEQLNFQEVYERYFKDVFLYVKGLSGDASIAEEVTAETFFKALRSLNQSRGDCDVRVWLCQIAKNTYFTYCKKRKRLAPVPETAAAEDFRLDERLADREDAFAIHQFLHAMEEPYKEVFSLRVFGELLYFFELACGISGHVLGVNPFNQPGVEAYKKNMFALLGKP